jgi:NAD(P)-dependent dehydrogenase (short-subunit alcohol dehydrogenase family)
MRLTNKVAIVTGAAQGIGEGIAHVFAEEGARVVIADIKDEAGKAVAEAIRQSGGQAQYAHADVTLESDVRQLIEATVGKFGGLNILVNNAGTAVVGTVEECTVEEWDHLMAINVRSIFLTSKYAVPHLRRGGGAILNVGSVSSLVAQQGTPCYCASKGAVLMLTKSLALDYAPDKIRVNCLCPGVTDTPLLRFHMGHTPDPEAHLRQRLGRVPTGEMLYPEDMGRAAAFLCSDDARGITGAHLLVDGGYLACAEFFR